MTEEPYRWLEAIANRREYVQNQIKDGAPVLAASLSDGILLLGVGAGHRKVFEIFDRHALAGLGHPADLERVRQALIDAAHVEAFTRAPEDVSLRRLVGFNLGPQLKTAFEQIFAPPFLVRLLLAELGTEPTSDTLLKLGFDGTFAFAPRGVVAVAAETGAEAGIEGWLRANLDPASPVSVAGPILLAAWRKLAPPTEPAPDVESQPTIEAALLRRDSPRLSRYESVPTTDWGPVREPATR